MFTGLSAFPLTPMDERGIDEGALVSLVSRLVNAGVDSIGALGSTGNYAYLTREERSRVARLSVEAAHTTPVMVGIGAPRTTHVLANAEDAQRAGAAALLLAPVSYQPLTAEEVYELYAEVDRHVSVPVCVYDNPVTTRFVFTDELYRELARLPSVHAFKVPAPPATAAEAHIPRLRELVGTHAALGISGDALAGTALLAGASMWFSVIGGLLPDAALAITRAAQAGDLEHTSAASDRLQGFWALFETYGSLRVVAAVAAELGLTQQVNLPRPLRPIAPEARRQVADILERLERER